MPEDSHNLPTPHLSDTFDFAAIVTAVAAALPREARVMALIVAAGALRQRDLAVLLGVSGPTISRLVKKLLSTGAVREYTFNDGEIGRPTAWLVSAAGALPSLELRQAIVARMPEVISALQTLPTDVVSPDSCSSTVGRSSAPMQENVAPVPLPVVAADLPVTTWTYQPAGTAPPAQSTLPLWFETTAGDRNSLQLPSPTAHHTSYPAPYAAPTMPPAPQTPLVSAPSMQLRIVSPPPPWQHPPYRSHCGWRQRVVVGLAASVLLQSAGKAVWIVLSLLFLGACELLWLLVWLAMALGRLPWGGLRLLWSGLRRLVWWLDDRRTLFAWQQWLLLGIAVVVLVGVLFGIRHLPAGTATAHDAPTRVPTAPLAATPTMSIRTARVVGAGSVGLIVRAEPGGRRIGKLADGAEVQLLAGPTRFVHPTDPVWWQVQRGTLVGWVSARFLQLRDRL